MSFFADIWDKFNKDKNLVCKGKSLQLNDDPPQNLLENKIETENFHKPATAIILVSKMLVNYVVQIVHFQTIKLQSLEIKKTSFVYKAP